MTLRRKVITLWRMPGVRRGSLEFHVDAFRDVGTEAGRDDDAAAYLQRSVVAGPHRVAAGPKVWRAF